MKTRLIFLVMLITCLSCGTKNKPVPNAQKEKIIGEVKEAVSSMIKGGEEANFDMTMGQMLDSPDFIYIINGKTYSYKELMDAYKAVFSTMQNQKGTIRDEKYIVLDNSTVLYTTNSKWLMNFKDGSSVLQDPWIVQFTYKKTDGKWKIMAGVESGKEKVVKASEAPKALNQVELESRFIGIWKTEAGKDTITTIEVRPFFSGGFVTDLKIESKGKAVMREKTLLGYDKKTDKLIESAITDMGPGIQLMTAWFTEPNMAMEIPLEDISNPESASLKWTFEFKSPDLVIWTEKAANKEAKAFTMKRVSK